MNATLPELDCIDKHSLANANGQTFPVFKRTLVPSYFRVWRDILGGHTALVLSCVAVLYAEHQLPTLWPAAALVGAFLIGYVVAFIQLFFHEAAHYNLAKSRKLNDFLANLFIGLMIGQDIKAYRTVHFDHHRYLGTPKDTERSYFEALTWRFVFEALTGIKAIKVLRRRGAFVRTRRKAAGNLQRKFLLLSGVVLNAGIVAGSLAFGRWALALAWPAGLLLVHPFVNALRQLLEHRSFSASARVDYSVVPHGAVTRMFGDGLLASTLGGAGFNRHLLHHWEPQISYTCFRQLERFLLQTSAADLLRRNTTTYFSAARKLLQAGR